MQSNRQAIKLQKHLVNKYNKITKSLENLEIENIQIICENFDETQKKHSNAQLCKKNKITKLRKSRKTAGNSQFSHKKVFAV